MKVKVAGRRRRAGGRSPSPPSSRALRGWADALRLDRDELSGGDYVRCAALLEAAAAWIEATSPQPKGRPDVHKTWTAVMMVARLRTKGRPDWRQRTSPRPKQPYIDNDQDAIAAVVGARKGPAFERVRRKLWDWRNGKRPRSASMNMAEFHAVLNRLARTHRIK